MTAKTPPAEDAWQVEEPEIREITIKGAPFTVLANYRFRDLRLLQSSDADVVLKALDRLVVKHPFHDAEGNPAPLEDLSSRQLQALIEGYFEALKIPKA